MILTAEFYYYRNMRRTGVPDAKVNDALGSLLLTLSRDTMN